MRTISADTYAMSNPALTSILLWQFAKSYGETKGSAPALSLAFIVLPITMSRPAIESFTGTNKTTGFLTWLSRKPELMIELASTIADARELTSEALRFGIAYGLFTINADGALEAKPEAVTFKTRLREDERLDMVRAAHRLGTWTSHLPDQAVFFSIGVAP
jgi:hypothetical protein